MKKEVVLLFVFGILIFLSNSIQVSAKYACSNNTEIDYEVKEIMAGDVKIVNGLPIGVCGADESIDRIAAELIIDSKEISLLNSSAVEVILLGSTHSVTLVNSESESATIKVSDSSLEIDKNNCEKIGALEVMLVNTGQVDGNATADLIVGTKKLSLSNKEKEEEIVEIASIKYLVELFSASDSEASVKVGKCPSGGDLVEIADVENNQTNVTANDTEQDFILNETYFDNNETMNDTALDGENENNLTEMKNEIGSICGTAEECFSGFCDDGMCAKKGFFAKVIEWFKGLFG